MRYMEIPVRTECSQPYARLETYILDTPADKIRIARRPMVIICPAADMKVELPGGGASGCPFYEPGISCLRASIFRGAVQIPGSASGTGNGHEANP